MVATPIIKTPEQIAKMRESGRIVAHALQTMREAVQPGISTQALNAIAEAVLHEHNATPAFLGYAPGGHPPFPGVITASINDELVHGIPSPVRVLQEGDIVSLDIACIHDGWVGDAAITVIVGQASPAVKRLVQATEETLAEVIEVCRAGHTISDIAQRTMKCAARYGYSVAREYTGHGVGQTMHEAPQVPNWWPKKVRQGERGWPDFNLVPGMTFAIEPMLIAGRDALYEKDDGWTVATRDGVLCAHAEHTVAITEGDPIVLTRL